MSLFGLFKTFTTVAPDLTPKQPQWQTEVNPTGTATYNPFERPSVPLASVALDGMVGGRAGSDAGEAVDPFASLMLPTAYRCISVIATVVASCPIEVVNSSGEATPWDAIRNLESYTEFEIKELMVTHMAGWGNFFAFPVTKPGDSNRLIDLQPIFPGHVSVLRKTPGLDSERGIPNGAKFFRVKVPTEPGNQGNKESYKDYLEEEIFHIPFLGYDGLAGMSPVMAAAQTFGTSLASDRLAARFHANGQMMGGVVKVKAPLASQTQADTIKQRWMNRNGGARNAGGVVILDAETDFQPLTINPDSLQLIESRGWQMQELARVYGVPLTMLSTNSTGYGDAIETQQIGFVTYTVRQYTDRIEQRLSRWFQPRGKTVKFDLDSLMRGSMTERYAAYSQAILAGWMTRAEPRVLENMKPIPAKTGEYDLTEPLVPQANTGLPSVPPLLDPTAPVPAPPAPPTNESEAGSDTGDSDDGN